MQQSILICLETIDCVQPNLDILALLNLAEHVHLIGAHTIPGIHYSRAMNPNKLHGLYVEIQKKHRKDADQIKGMFEAGTRSLTCNLSYTETRGAHVFDYAPYWHAARFADFVVCSHLPSIVPEISLQRELIINGGAPVIVPSSDSRYENTKSISECDIGILWNGRVDCARAVRVAAPFLERAKSVEIRIDPLAEFDVESNIDATDLSYLEEFFDRTHIRVKGYANAPTKPNTNKKLHQNLISDPAEETRSDILVLGASSYFNNLVSTGQAGTLATLISS